MPNFGLACFRWTPRRDRKRCESTASHLLHLHHRTLPRLHEGSVCSRAALRGADRPHAGAAVRPTQSRWEARRNEGAQIRSQIAARSDEGDRALLNPQRGGGGGESGRGGAGAQRASSVLGIAHNHANALRRSGDNLLIHLVGPGGAGNASRKVRVGPIDEPELLQHRNPGADQDQRYPKHAVDR